MTLTKSMNHREYVKYTTDIILGSTESSTVDDILERFLSDDRFGTFTEQDKLYFLKQLVEHKGKV